MTLEHLLDLCLAQLNTGDADLATVLAQYPEQRAALEPMLRAALAVRHTPAPAPSQEARLKGRERLAAALMARLPAEALDAALAGLQRGATVDEALADNPHAAEVRPLLQLALAIENVPEPTPRLEAQAVGYARLLAAVGERRRILTVLDEALARVQAGTPVDAVLAELGPDAATLGGRLRAAAAVTAAPMPHPAPAAKAAGLARLQAAAERQRTLDTVLDRALAEVRAGDPMRLVLARYPQHAEALAPRLKMAQAVAAAPQPVAAPQARAAGLERVMAAAAQRQAFEVALDTALADLRAGRADIPMLVARTPQFAAELEPMLLSAQAAMESQRVARPRAQAEGRARLMAAVSARRAALVAEKLDVAVARLRAGESVEAILAADPAFRAELEPLLRAAQTVERTPAPVANATARANGERLLLDTARARRHADQPLWKPLAGLVALFHAPRGVVRQVFIAAVALMFLVSSTLVGVTRAAANSLPDEALYPVKLATEQVQLALAPSPEARAQLHIAFAQERLREVQAAVDAGRDPSRALAQLPRHTDSVQTLADVVQPEQRDRLEAQIKTVKDQEKAVIGTIKDKLPAETRSVVEQIVGTPTTTAAAAAATATATSPAPTIAPPTAPVVAQRGPQASGPTATEAPVVLPTKTLLPPPVIAPPTATPVSGIVVVLPTQPPAQVPPTQAPPTTAPTVAEAASATPRPPQIVQPSGGRSATRTPEPTAVPPTTVPPTAAPTNVTAAPTNTPLPQSTATATPVTPAPTVIIPPTRVPRPTATSVPPTAVPPTAVPPTAVPPTAAPPTTAPTSQPTSAPPADPTKSPAPNATPKP